MAYLSLLGAALFISARTFLLTMSASWAYNFLMGASFILTLTNLAGQFYSRNRALDQYLREVLDRLEMLDPESRPSRPSRMDYLRQRYYWAPDALWALWTLIMWGILLTILMRAHNPLMLSTPYPEIALAGLALSILAFAFSFYRLLRRRARYLEAMREGQ